MSDFKLTPKEGQELPDEQSGNSRLNIVPDIRLIIRTDVLEEICGLKLDNVAIIRNTFSHYFLGSNLIGPKIQKKMWRIETATHEIFFVVMVDSLISIGHSDREIIALQQVRNIAYAEKTISIQDLCSFLGWRYDFTKYDEWA